MKALELTVTDTHALRFNIPTWGDYHNGGYGDLVAQCECGHYEYVSSQDEGRYWHWLHRTNANARSGSLLRLLVENPMPEGWTEPRLSVASAVNSARKERRYTCSACMGSGQVEAGGGFGGRFYNYGSGMRASCPDCLGSGATDRPDWLESESTP